MAHCAAMCGPLSSAVSLRASKAGLGRYQIGRALSYAFLGALSGHLGKALQWLTPSALSAWVVASLTAAACLLTARALLRSNNEPTALVQLRTEPQRRRSLFTILAQLVPREPFVFGLLSVLLPCGVLASALLAAVASGSALSGGALMSAFAGVSGLAVLGAGLTTQLVPRRFAAGFRRAIAYALVALALLAVYRPLHALTLPPREAAALGAHCH